MKMSRFLLLTAACLPTIAGAREVNLPITLNYGLVRNALVQQLFTGDGQSARVWKDGKQCSFLDLSNPQIAGENGQIKIANNVHAQIGTKLGGACMPMLNWSGILETFQQPTLDAGGNQLNFPITRSNAYDASGRPLNIGQLQELLQKVAAPKLAALKLDLNQSRGDIVKALLPYIDADNSEQLHDIVNSLRFNQIKVNDAAMVVNVGFNSPNIQVASKQSSAPLNADELAQWRSAWQGWQASLDQAIGRAPLDGELANSRGTLQGILQQAGSAFEQGLSGNYSSGDPVREFLDSSWDQMAPLLRAASKQFPGAESLRYLTLIAATDMIYELEAIGAPLGLEISSNGLRKIARNYLANQRG